MSESSNRRIEAVELVRVGRVQPAITDGILRRLDRCLTASCRLQPRSLHKTITPLPGRPGQLNANKLLNLIEAIPVPDHTILVAITSHDIALPIFTFVFGLARIHGHSAIVSLARLREPFYGMPDNPAVTVRRAVDEILHEAGHLMGLQHCDDYRCLMSFASSIEKVDLRDSSYCRECLYDLPEGLHPRCR